MKFAVKVVMVDLDGTLIHTAPEIAVAANEMLKALDFAPLHLELVESFIGEGAPMLVKRCLATTLGLNTTLGAEPAADLFERAERLFFEHYANNAHQSLPYAGVQDGLQTLSDAGFRLACVTNKPEKLRCRCSNIAVCTIFLRWWFLATRSQKRSQTLYNCSIFVQNSKCSRWRRFWWAIRPPILRRHMRQVALLSPCPMATTKVNRWM